MLAFPGIFRGAFDVRASDINEEMKMAAAQALAGSVWDDDLSADYIIPAAFDPRVGPAVAKAVAEAARRSRRGKDLSPTGGTKRPCRRPRRRQTGMEHLTERNAE